MFYCFGCSWDGGPLIFLSTYYSRENPSYNPVDYLKDKLEFDPFDKDQFDVLQRRLVIELFRFGRLYWYHPQKGEPILTARLSGFRDDVDSFLEGVIH